MNISQSAAVPFDRDDVPLAQAQIARLVEVLKSEFDLIASRMTWLVVSESFIFSAFATAAASYRKDHPMALALWYLLAITPVMLTGIANCSIRR